MFEAEPGFRLDRSAANAREKDIIKDPVVVRLASGAFLMAYILMTPN